MNFTTREQDSDLIIQVKGVIEGITILSLSKHIENYCDTNLTRVVIDMNGVTRIDSHGLGGLTYCDILLKKKGKKLVIVTRNDIIKGLISRCNLDKVLDIQDTL